MRISKTDTKELQQHREALTRSALTVTSRQGEFLRALRLAEHKINAVVREHNAVVAAARAFVERIAGELDDEIDGKSDRWKESDAGEAASAMKDEWSDASLDDLDPVHVLAPDLPINKDAVEAYKLDLSEESEG